MRTRLRSLAALALGGALFLGAVMPAAAADQAMVRAAHLIPDAPAVDVLVNGNVVLKDVPYKAVSDYLMVDAGTYKISINQAGTATELLTIDAKVEAGKAYTVAAIGTLDAADTQDPRLTAYVDNPVASSDTAKLRVIHASPTTPAVDVNLKGAAAADAPIKNLAFPDASSYLDLPGGTYDFVVYPTGGDPATPALDLSGTTLENGKNYTVFAVGLLEGTGAQALGVVVAVDGTLPDSATENVPAGSTPVLVLALGLLAIAGVGLAFGRRLGTVRAK
jgi:Domain of unknown function (DUF4397)